MEEWSDEARGSTTAKDVTRSEQLVRKREQAEAIEE